MHQNAYRQISRIALRRILGALLFACLLILPSRIAPQGSPRKVDIVRDRWGIAHVFAANENDGFYGAGYASAEDRLLQMELFRRRANGRLAEILGEKWVESDRKFRIAGIGRHCIEAAANLPDDMRGYLNAYAAGVNAWAKANPSKVQKRFAMLAIDPEPWTEADSICAWMGAAELFDPVFDEGAATLYRSFKDLAAQVGETEALAQPGMMIDDPAAVVSETEFAKDAAAYARLKALPHIPGYWQRSLPDDMLRFSHAWAVDGTRSTTGRPILESDPQTSVNNPPLWYEFHLSAGRFDVRGVGFAGSPAMLIGFNRNIAWGASALGAGSTVTFIEKLSADGTGYLYRGQTVPFDRRTETIQVKGSRPVSVDVLTNRHGFVFNPLAKQVDAGQAYVSYIKQVQDKGTSVRGLLGMMAAKNWGEFRSAMGNYYSPGIHIVYADIDGNIGYQTMVQTPLTKRTPRMALEGWTGDDEVLGRVALADMPHMLNPDSHFVSHANNLPVGSWYPYDLGISTGGTGHSARSLRLVQLLTGSRQFSLDTFESDVHRDDVQSAVAAMFPVARRLAAEMQISDASVTNLLTQLKDWDLHYRTGQPTYAAAQTLSGNALPAYRQAALNSRLGGGEGGICHLARLLADQFGNSNDTPKDQDVRDYLISWLRTAGGALPPRGTTSRYVQQMPYQANGPLGFGSLDSRFDLTSPTLSSTEVGTIWSQLGNSYTQIVDLRDPDNSRTVLPPGVSEDPDSAFHTNQMDTWVRGGTHEAPLSRSKVEEGAASVVTLQPAGIPASGRIAVANGASFALETVLSPGSIASLFGSGLAAATVAGSGLPMQTKLADTQVLVNGVAAPLWYVSPSQINFQVPFGLSGSALISVVSGGVQTATAAVPVAAAAPGVFALAGLAGRAAVLNQDSSLNSTANPAAAGSVIQIFVTGLGATSPAMVTGQTGAQAEPLHRTVLTPLVSIGGIPADLLFSGAAPGFVGVDQINARVPPNISPGDAVSLVVSADGYRSNTLAICVRAAAVNPAAQIPACSASGPVFDTLPMALADFIAFRPLGWLSPPVHMFPAKHSSFNLALPGEPSPERPVRFPTAVWVTEIWSAAYPSGLTGYQLYFQPCDKFRAYFFHLKTIAPELKAQLDAGPKACSNYVDQSGTIVKCQAKVMLQASSGQLAGTSGDGAGVDFGAADFRVAPDGFVNLQHYPYDYPYYVSPVDYLRSDLKAAFQAKLTSYDGTVPRTAEPRTGSYRPDLPGTAQGNWFSPGVYMASSTDLSTAIALVHDYIDATQPVFSSGTSVKNLSMGLYAFAPLADGKVNRDFSQVTADGSIYCYDSFLLGRTTGGGPLSAVNGIILISLESATRLKVEKQGTSGTTCRSTQPWKFTESATTFER